jgi:rare lipoprotein A
MLSLGLLFLSTPGQASLEKIKIAPHAQPARLVTVKVRMIASWYGQEFQGRLTASGEMFDQHKLTAAHRTLPLGSLVKLTAKSTGKSVIVRINDRGPWIKGRDFDLSEAAATKLGIHENGIAAVEATLINDGVIALAGAPRR